MLSKDNLDIATERITALVLIVYGYFLLIGILGILIFSIGLFYAYKSYTE